ncbi:MAG TPA: nuclear transport factor 2 family protein [Pseudonocardiaceae bacterium]|nr:nuclear transport factor 2 family protein [Pseudonocardiaceae bacterium]
MPWTAEAAIAYVDHHVGVWNSHDLDEIVALYGKDVELVSPLAEEVVGAPVVRGRDELRHYFGTALKANPELRFEVLDVLRGEDSITFYMRGIGGRKVAEVLFIDADGLIGKVFAHYSCSS